MEKYEFSQSFLKSILKNMSGNEIQSIMNGCAECHYKANDMDNVLCNYIGDLEAFIVMLEGQWAGLLNMTGKKGV